MPLTRLPTQALLRLAGPGLPSSVQASPVTTDSNPRACALDPWGGTALVLAEAVANLACVGATPAAVVNCLNFGNPEHPEVMWQLSECIDGMSDACRALSLPVIGGNVSLYNESGGADIDPTPVLGVLGLVEELQAPPPGTTWAQGDAIVLLGVRSAPDGSFPLEGTRWATERRDHRTGSVPSVDFAAHGALCGFVASLVAAQVAGGGDDFIHAVHDVSGGGLGVARGGRDGRRLGRSGCLLEGVAGGPAEGSSPSCPSRFVVATARPDELCGPGRRGGHHRLGARAAPLETVSCSASPGRPPAGGRAGGLRGDPDQGVGRFVMPQGCARMGDA